MNIFTLDKLNVKKHRPITGSLALRELYLQPDWKKPPKNNILFSYTRKSNPGFLSVVYIEEGKTYDFATIQTLIRKHLDSDDNLINIFYNDRKVTFWIKPAADLKVTFCDELVKVLRLPQMNNLPSTGVIQSGIVAEEAIKLTFGLPQMLYLKCKELEDPVLAIIPVGERIKFRDDNPLFIDLKTNVSIFELHFSITNEYDNKLPFKKLDFRVLNKE